MGLTMRSVHPLEPGPQMLTALLLASALGCSAPPPAERTGSTASELAAPLPEAFCTAIVDGVGEVDTEGDYLPNVVNCENGGAGLEALKVQAIAARSVLYYAMGTSGSICDGSGCQVYSCSKTPSALHIQAVEETSGVYLAYNGNVTYAAYRSGDADTAPPSCIGPDDQSAITYNEGKSGTDVEQTGSLYVHDPDDAGYGTNRGCMSQNGAACLEDSLGYDYRQILQFYYGQDIELLQAPGGCILPLPGEGGAGGAAGSSSAGGSSTGGAGAGGAGGVNGGGAAVGGQGASGGSVAGSTGDDDEGCGCRAVGSRTSGAPPTVWALALGGLVGARRCRRKQRTAERPARTP